MKSIAFASTFCLLILMVPAFAGPRRVRGVSFVEEGSAPQASLLYLCARNLKGQVFDESKARGCLNELLVSKFFEKGEFSVKDRGSEEVELIFHLKSPALVITSLKYELPQREMSDLEAWLGYNDGGLRAGDVYTSDAEAKTFYGIQNFFRSRGQAALFNSTVNLNYRSGNAEVSYHFVLGPIAREETTLALLADCRHRIRYLDLTGIDDTVPFPLVDQILRVRAFSCFDENLLEQDEKRMLASGFITEANFSVVKDGEDRDVTLVARGDQLTVHSIDVVGFGRKLNLLSSQIAALPLQAGQKYRNSLAEESAESLQKSLSDSGHKISVTPRATLVDRRQLHVEFDVIVSPEDELFIDGERYATKG